MTATDAIWTQDGSFTALEDRALISALTGARHFTDLAPGISKVDAGGGHGVVGASDLTVSAGAGHSVDVAAGQAFVRGTQSAGQGTYVVGNDATVNLAISTPDATNDRIDLIQIRVSDDSAGAGATTLDVKAGTPAGSPSAPTPDENALVLAQVLVPASAASSANYTITDKRTRAAALGGTQVCDSSATYPDPATEGMRVYDKALDAELIYSGSAWVVVGSIGAWSSYTPSMTNITVGNGTRSGRYKQVGKTVHFAMHFELGSTSSVSSGASVGLPVAVGASAPPVSIFPARFRDITGNYYMGVAAASPAATSAGLVVDSGGAVSSTVPFTWATGDQITVSGTYEVS